MRTLAVLLALAGMALSAIAEKRVTVAQLEQTLIDARGTQDTELAQRLSEMELTERLSATTLARLQAGLPGQKTTNELVILSDEAAFLPLPANEIPVTAAPDAAAQRQIMSLVVDYVAKTVHQMPNFMASRETHSFQDRPEGLFTHRPLHLVGQTSAAVIYKDGREVEAPAGERKKGAAETKGRVAGLVSRGEFGPILSTVLLDAARSTLAWSHWESGPERPVAVFRYTVPRKQSHYEVRLGIDPNFLWDFHELSGYHGEMAIDPESGAILRVTALADLAPEEPVVRASIMVEYGPVEIGGKSYICPLRSVALAQRPQQDAPLGAVPARSVKQTDLITLLNEVEFKQYHVFRGDSRILTAEEADALPVQATPDANVASSVSGPSESSQGAPPDAHAEPARVAEEDRAATIDTAKESEAERSVDIPRTPLIKTTTREVVVDVVVTKANGDPVAGLAMQDFAITEDGSPQAIDFFEEHTAGTHAAAPQPAMPQMPAGAHTNVPPAPETDAVNVLLLDTLNSEQQDQAYVRNQVMNFVTHMQPGTRVAIFMLGSKLRFVQGFTSDTSVLLAALKEKRNGPGKNRTFQSRSDLAADADEVAMLQTMQASPYAIEALQAAQADVAAFSFLSRAAMTFEALTYLGHYLAGVPGRKNLIWFAESFPVIIFPTAEQRLQLKKTGPPGYLDKVKQTADLLTISKVAVYPVSAVGVMTEHIIDAGAAAPGGGSLGHIGSSAATTMGPYIAGAAGRADAIYAMEQLAASTGGKAYYNTNDLNGAMRRAINDGAHYYTIAYSPTAKKMDGSYRQIEVKVRDGNDRLAYRHGYNADDAPPIDAKTSGDPLAPLLALGLPAGSGVLYGVKVEPTSTQPGPDAVRVGNNPVLKGPLTRYVANFVIRIDDVTWQTNSKGMRTGRILVGLKAYDHDGNPINWEGNMETLEMSAGEYESRQKTGIPAHLEIDLPADHDLRVVTAIYDWNSGKAGSLEVPVGPRAAKSDSTGTN